MLDTLSPRIGFEILILERQVPHLIQVAPRVICRRLCYHFEPDWAILRRENPRWKNNVPFSEKERGHHLLVIMGESRQELITWLNDVYLSLETNEY